MEEKRIRGGAIIIVEDTLVTMYREFQDRIYYTFPGGGLEKGETIKECVVREVREEFGIEVKPIKKLYNYEGARSLEYFYLCEWVSGEFGTGDGEEYGVDNKYGKYIPTMIKIKDIPNLPLMPPEIATSLYNDYINNNI